jgi:hypothetical protein
MNVPLSVLRGARLPTDPWTRRDAALAQAAKTLDRSRCSGCGQPTWLSHDKASKWRPKQIRCQSCNAIEDLKATLPEEVKNAQALHFYTEHVP